MLYKYRKINVYADYEIMNNYNHISYFLQDIFTANIYSFFNLMHEMDAIHACINIAPHTPIWCFQYDPVIALYDLQSPVGFALPNIWIWRPRMWSEVSCRRAHWGGLHVGYYWIEAPKHARWHWLNYNPDLFVRTVVSLICFNDLSNMQHLWTKDIL